MNEAHKEVHRHKAERYCHHRHGLFGYVAHPDKEGEKDEDSDERDDWLKHSAILSFFLQEGHSLASGL